MLVRNKNLIQSYILSTAYYDFNVHEKRILYRVVELLQEELKGKKLSKVDYIINPKTLDREFTLPISSFLKSDEDKNYAVIKEALVRLNSKVITYEDDRVWELFNIIERPRILKYDSYISFKLSADICNAFLSFSKGFRKYDLQIAFLLESTYAMRFYEILSGKQKQQINYSIEELKKIFGIEHKYKTSNSNFIQYVIEPSKKELDKVSPVSFHYEPCKTGRKITHINFKVYEIPKNKNIELEKKQLQQKESLHWSLDSNQIRYLKDYFDFTEKGIKNNIDVIKQFANLENAEDQLRNINKMVLEYDIRNKAGFFIKQAQKLIENNK